MTSPVPTSAPVRERDWTPGFDVNVRRILIAFRRGAGDPTFRLDPDGTIWRTSRMPSGPVSYRIRQLGRRQVQVHAWGDGAAEFLVTVPALLGEADNPDDFDPRHPLLEDAFRRFPGIRVPRSGRVLESLVPAVLEQKVTGKQAFGAFRYLVRRYGEPAPGPSGLMLQPTADQWRLIPSWEWHKAGVEPARSATVMRALRVIDRLEQCVDLEPDAALARLRLIPGIGEWTAAEIAQRALGNADALSVGDYHIAAFVGWSMLGRPIDDAEMVAYLEPWRGHRHRVVLLLGAHPDAVKPKFGPRMTIQDHRRH